MGLTRNQVCPQGYRGFESLFLRLNRVQVLCALGPFLYFIPLDGFVFVVNCNENEVDGSDVQF